MSINRDRKRKQVASACVDIRTLFCPSKRTCEQVQSDPLIAPSPLPASTPALTSEPSQKELAVLEEREQPPVQTGLLMVQSLMTNLAVLILRLFLITVPQ